MVLAMVFPIVLKMVLRMVLTMEDSLVFFVLFEHSHAFLPELHALLDATGKNSDEISYKLTPA